LLAPDIIAQHAITMLNRETLLQSVCKYSLAFSERQLTVKDQIAEGDKVEAHMIYFILAVLLTI